MTLIEQDKDNFLKKIIKNKACRFLNLNCNKYDIDIFESEEIKLYVSSFNLDELIYHDKITNMKYYQEKDIDFFKNKRNFIFECLKTIENLEKETLKCLTHN